MLTFYKVGYSKQAATTSRYWYSYEYVSPCDPRTHSIVTNAYLVCSNPDGVIWPPSLGADSRCAAGTPAPHYGQRMWLDMTNAEIDALPGQEWQRVIYRTLATYGAYYYDSLGSYGINWAVECVAF